MESSFEPAQTYLSLEMLQHQQTSRQNLILRLKKMEPLLHQQLLERVKFYQCPEDLPLKLLVVFFHQAFEILWGL